MNENSIDKYEHLLLGGASITYRQDPQNNQDGFALVTNAQVGLKAMIIADGLGSYAYPKEAATRVTEFVKQGLEKVATPNIDYNKIFRGAKRDLQRLADTYRELPDEALGTTLIVVVEQPDAVTIAYVGNGAVWHLRGDFNHFSENRSLPWNSLNYLNPHTVQNPMGKEALYRLISNNNSEDEATPTILRINKDELHAGDIFIACTDGLYSTDQIPVGKLGNGTLWLGENDRMAQLYSHLDKFFQSVMYITTLSEALMSFLEHTHQNEPLDDDTTMAMLVTKRAFKYQQTKMKRNQERG